MEGTAAKPFDVADDDVREEDVEDILSNSSSEMDDFLTLEARIIVLGGGGSGWGTCLYEAVGGGCSSGGPKSSRRPALLA